MIRRLRAVLVGVLAVLVVIGTWAATSSASAASCRVESIRPHSIEVGLRPVRVKLGVRTSCAVRGWLIEGAGFTADSSRPRSTVSPARLTNRSAGASSAVVTLVTGPSTITTTTLRDAIVLRRASAWSRPTMTAARTGHRVKIAATLTTADWDHGTIVPAAHRTVVLEVEMRPGDFRPVRHVRTDASGQVRTTLRVLHTARWRLRAPQSAELGAATSASTRITSR